MKIRSGFVTNSSSSSFILAFKDDKDFSKFKDRCDYSGYEEIAKMAKRIRKGEDRTLEKIKEDAITNLHLWMTIDEKRRYMATVISNSLPFVERLKKEQEIEESEEYKKHIETFLSKTNFEELKKQISEAGIVIDTTVWDSNGGLLEFAIRNGILREYYFNEWFVSQIDVG